LFGAKYGMENIPQEWVDGVENNKKLIVLDSQLYFNNIINK